jgi:predicted Rossmann fold flavoprotein
MKAPVGFVVAGGGAAGFLAAITAAEAGVADVHVLEATAEPLTKVRISGGGRCNVTHACWDPLTLVGHYPRGSRALRGPFSRFAPGDAVAWFADHGVELITEADGRMFPSTHSSATVVAALRTAARRAGVQLHSRCALRGVVAPAGPGEPFGLQLRGEGSAAAPVACRRLLLATGGHPSGRALAAQLGHRVLAPVPSLFTLRLNEPRLQALAGLVQEPVALALQLEGVARPFRQRGPLLLTHWGCSGPALLRLTAFAARDLALARYQGQLTVDWTGGLPPAEVHEGLRQQRQQHGARSLGAQRPLPALRRRLWLALLAQADLAADLCWAALPKAGEQRLLQTLVASCYAVEGRGPFGEEFVTAGGVDLGDVNLATMESRRLDGLHLAGELLDVDGVTGGFNFQHCWTSGWLAGRAIAASLAASDSGDHG